jgi:putative RNA 2'-phosphotransferase
VADPRAVKVSKFLARHLRHSPERIGLQLDEAGWVAVDALLSAAARAGFPITRSELDAAVAEPVKRRYAYDASGERVRAVQGHSVAVSLGYAPKVPPAVLFHGTHPGVVGRILDEGLRPMARHHVHLSGDVETARVVGARRGRPVVLAVDAAGMFGDGVEFLRADNGIWLVAAVPPARLRVVDWSAGPAWPARTRQAPSCLTHVSVSRISWAPASPLRSYASCTTAVRIAVSRAITMSCSTKCWSRQTRSDSVLPAM